MEAFPRAAEGRHGLCGHVRWAAGRPGSAQALQDIDVSTGDWDGVPQGMQVV
jgi:hypothetical protein